ncbi:hypothetical protein EZS27_009555 [termite gut metagenome]|uniref:DUF2442 domain-containing protein n=1 Tax=termite gut metagenome TaxID=433724 RepID=A0A5J4S9J9_9ZZZZ
MYLAVKEVIPQNNYMLLLTFENGEKKQFDFKPYLNIGIFKDLIDIDMFNSVKVRFDTIEWKNEAVFDPETLYYNSVPVSI